MATVYLRKDGRWEARLLIGRQENGKRKYISFYDKSEEMVRYKLDKALKEMESSRKLTDMTVHNLFCDWLRATASRHKDSTVANYKMKFKKHIEPRFGEINCTLITPNDIHDYIADKRDSALSDGYIRDILTLFKSIFRYAERTYQVKNIFNSVTTIRKEHSLMILPDKQALDALGNYIYEKRDRISLSIAMACEMGMRIGEVCAVRCEDIDWEEKILTVRNTVQRISCNGGTKVIISAPKTVSSMRKIPIPEKLYEMMTEFRTDDDNNFILTGTVKCAEPRNIQYHFDNVLKKLRIEHFNYHALRHMFATRCIQTDGFDIKTLSEILGHSSPEITLRIYVHSDMNRKKACMKLLESVA